MRTIIINTLGSELRQNPLFYLPFGDDRFHWIEQPLETVDACVEQLCCYNDAQDTRQECHLVVMVSLANYKLASYAQLRTAYKECLFAHLNDKLLMPLVQERKQRLAGVSVIFVLPQPKEGTQGIPAEEINLHILGVDPEADKLDTFALVDDDGVKMADLSSLFTEIVNDYRVSRQNVLDSGNLEGTGDHPGKYLRKAVAERLKELQTCKYLRPGEETPVVLPVQQVEYWLNSDEWELFSVDMQLNLSEHLQKNLSSDRVWKLELVPHDVKTIQDRIHLALRRVNYLQKHAPQLAFYEADPSSYAAVKSDISGDIWAKLKENTQLPGMEEVEQAAALEQEEREDAVQKERESLGKKLRQKWLLIGLEKKRFEKLYKSLQDQYDPEAAAKQQKTVLDACADVFMDWRRKVLSRKEDFPQEAKATEIPDFDLTAREEELAQAQQEWGQAAVAQLEDYTDVREEAEKVKAEFRKAYRLWPEGKFNATSKFCVYSTVLAALFLLQMLLPYIGITMGQDGVQLSRYVHFTLSLVMFTSLYALGVLLWMRVMCKQLRGYSLQMQQLLHDSYARRRESIIHAVAAYGEILPRCTLYYEQLQLLQQIHEENLQRKERYNTHMRLLSKAEELLYELCTMLRLPHVQGSGTVQAHGGINFELPPSHSSNMPYYVFMSEKWGRS